MKKILLFAIPALILASCGKQETYVVGQTAFCANLEETSEEKVFCRDVNGNPLTGFVVQYYENGNKMREMTIKNGIENGPEKEYYENGNLKVEAMVKDSEAYGTSKLYHENGQLHMVIKWNGKDPEIVKLYDEAGNIVKPMAE